MKVLRNLKIIAQDRLSSELISSIRLMEVDHPDPIYIHPRVRGQPIIIWGGGRGPN